MKLLKLEFFKCRRRKILLVCAAVLAAELLWIVFSFLRQDAEDLIQGWMLIRLSLHDPVMPVNMEGVREGDCDKMKDYLKRLLEGYSELDIRDIE